MFGYKNALCRTQLNKFTTIFVDERWGVREAVALEEAYYEECGLFSTFWHGRMCLRLPKGGKFRSPGHGFGSSSIRSPFAHAPLLAAASVPLRTVENP